MRQIKYAGLILVAVLVVAALLLGCAPKPGEGLQIKIGILLPYSGIAASHAILVENGVRAKLDEVGWEIAGRKIELITEDTAGDPVTGVDKAKKLVEVDKVDVVIGTMFSHVAIAVDSYLAPLGTVHIHYQAHPKAVVKMGGNIFLPVGTSQSSSSILGPYVYDKLGYRTATVIFDDYVAGEDYTKGFIETFKESGGTIVQIQRSPLMTFDYAPYIVSMKDADVVAFWLIPPELPPFYAQMREYGRKMPMLYTSMSVTEEDLASIGDLSIGTLGQPPYSPLIDTDTNKQFVQNMEQKYGVTPHHYENGGYVSTTLFLEAVESTKGDTAPERISQALKKVKVDTPVGKVSFTDEGVGIGDVYIGKVVKIGDRLRLEVIETFSQVVKQAPWE